MAATRCEEGFIAVGEEPGQERDPGPREIPQKNFEPQACTLYSYATVQAIKQAAEQAKSLDPKKVAAVMHSGRKFKTAIGDLSFNKKGDVSRLDYVVYVWKKNPDGKITYVEIE